MTDLPKEAERKPIIQPGEEWEAAIVIVERDQGEGPYAASELLHEVIDAVEAVRFVDEKPRKVIDWPEA